jgi:hypothetical protein
MTRSIIPFYIVYLQHKTERSLNKAPKIVFKKTEKSFRIFIPGWENNRLAGNVPASLLKGGKR